MVITLGIGYLSRVGREVLNLVLQVRNVVLNLVRVLDELSSAEFRRLHAHACPSSRIRIRAILQKYGAACIRQT